MRRHGGALPDYYAVLGVPSDATADEIKAAYAAAIRRVPSATLARNSGSDFLSPGGDRVACAA